MTAILFLLLASGACWYFVLSKRAREEHTRPLKDFYRLSKDGQDAWETMGLAAALVGALFFSIFLVALLVMRIVS